MSGPRLPQCYGCVDRKARRYSRFCSQGCAASWAEELAAGNEDNWCHACKRWVTDAADGAPHEHAVVELAEQPEGGPAAWRARPS